MATKNSAMRFSLLLLLLLSWTLSAQTLELQDNMRGITGINSIAIFEDPTGQMTLEQIADQPFTTLKNAKTNHGVSYSAWWIRLQVRNSHVDSMQWSVKFLFSLFDTMEAWQFADTGLMTHMRKGDHHIDPALTPFDDRTVFTFHTDAYSENTLYFRLAYVNAGIAELFCSIWSPEALHFNQYVTVNLLVAIVTALLVLFLYNLFIFFVLRSRIYFWYILYLLGVILATLALNPIGAHYFWNDSLYLIDMIPFIAVVTINTSFMMFTRAFLETAKRLKQIDKLIVGLIVIDLAALMLALFEERYLGIKLMHLIAFTFLFFPLMGAWLWRKGFIIARGYTVASTVLSITITMSLLRFSGVLPTNELFFWLSRAGFIIEGVLLAIALADRISLIQRAYHESQEQITHTLEKEVKKRTIELEEAKRVAEELARNDMLTGIWNRRAFLEMTEKLLHNAKRHGFPLCVIMFDIDHFKAINDNYGHEAGDNVLKTFAQNLKTHTREADIFARIGGEEFIMVLPYSDLAQARKKAFALRANIQKTPIQTPQKKLFVTASLGIAQLDADNDTLDTMLARADRAMYFVKAHGRNGIHSL